MKANPGSGRICNFIMGVFRGAAPGALPQSLNRPRNFIVWRQQRTATAAEQRRTLLRQHSAVCNLQMQQRQVSKRLPTADHPKNAVTAFESERVLFKLQRTLTSIRYTMTEDRPWRFSSCNASTSTVLRQITC